MTTTDRRIDLRTEAQRGLHAGVGVADLALETVKEYVADVRERARTSAERSVRSVRQLDVAPVVLRDQATKALSARVEELSRDARARRDAVEKRVSELQEDARVLVADGVESAGAAYVGLAQRGATVVRRLRGETAAVVEPAPAPAPAKKAPATKAPAKKSTTKKAAARKAPATKKTNSTK